MQRLVLNVQTTGAMNMRISILVLALAVAVAPIGSQAAQGWTGCVTVVGLNNYIASSNAMILAVSPGVTGCVSTVNGVSGAITFQVGVNNVTSSSITSLLASSLTAYATGKSVMLYYDNSAGCFGQIVSNGGFGGQCP